tara:strand:+ start:66 stop:416 length:351 start_codon:yes stop_codon:yes gene_type:complete
MKDNPVVVGIIILMLCLAFLPANNYSFGLDSLQQDGTITCRSVDGEVIGKEIPVTLIVRVNDTVANKITTYNIYVSPSAYSNYSIGDKHTESICTITDYEYYKEIIDRLLESGILG